MIKKIITIILIGINCSSLASAQGKKAFMVGISKYQNLGASANNAWSNIHGKEDVELLKSIFQKKGFSVTALTDNKATANKIREGLDKFVQKCHRGDFMYIHFSTHGQPVEDYSGDEKDGWDEAIIPFDALMRYGDNGYIGSSHILDDELNTYIEKIRLKIGPQGLLIISIDACHAGTSYRGEDSTVVRGTNKVFSKHNKPYHPIIDKRSNIQVKPNKSGAPTYIIEACRSYQLNREIKVYKTYQGSLSYYIYSVLKDRNISKSREWIDLVVSRFEKDGRLNGQNLVIEYIE